MCIDAVAERPLRRAQDEKRDRDARLAELAERYWPSIRRLCQALLSDPAEAEDATQQTFLLAYQSMRSGVRPQQPRAWLCAIARRECWARERRRRRRQAVPEEAAHVELDPSDQVVLRSELAAVIDEFGRLPARQRQALALHELAGLSQRQLADTLESSESAVEALLVRARRNLRRSRFVLVWLPFPLSLPRSLRNGLRLAYRRAEAWASAGAHGLVPVAATTLVPLASVAAVVALSGSSADPARPVVGPEPTQGHPRTAVTVPSAGPRPQRVAPVLPAFGYLRADRRLQTGGDAQTGDPGSSPADTALPRASTAGAARTDASGGRPGASAGAGRASGTTQALPRARTPAQRASVPASSRNTPAEPTSPPPTTHVPAGQAPDTKPPPPPAPDTTPAGGPTTPPPDSATTEAATTQAPDTAPGAAEPPGGAGTPPAPSEPSTDPQSHGNPGTYGTVDGTTPGADPSPPGKAGSDHPGSGKPPKK